MKTDTYTKIIMTIIAVALVKIAFQDTHTIKPLFAQDDSNAVHKIAICNEYGNRCAAVDFDARLNIKFNN